MLFGTVSKFRRLKNLNFTCFRLNFADTNHELRPSDGNFYHKNCVFTNGRLDYVKNLRTSTVSFKNFKKITSSNDEFFAILRHCSAFN